jgi:hypothetical protein
MRVGCGQAHVSARSLQDPVIGRRVLVAGICKAALDPGITTLRSSRGDTSGDERGHLPLAARLLVLNFAPRGCLMHTKVRMCWYVGLVNLLAARAIGLRIGFLPDANPDWAIAVGNLADVAAAATGGMRWDSSPVPVDARCSCGCLPGPVSVALCGIVRGQGTCCEL